MPPALDPSLRSRIPSACAECRRLKLKCDKKKPCSSCVRRGCASICPQGRMVSKGSRFILANTEQLHEKIDALIGRVRQLESALETSHSLHSNEPHPLLWEELRLIATPVDSVTPEPERLVQEEELSDNMGTLTLNSHGSRYFGSTGAFAYLWGDGDGPDGVASKCEGEASLALAGLPTELVHMAHAFPVRLRTVDTAHLSTWILENCLPPFPVAWSLFENYWEHYAWHLTPVTRATFVKQILSPLYHRSPDNGEKPLGHRLSLLFIVFAIGDLLDLTRPLTSSTGLRYYLLARASLCLDAVFESPTVTALQAMYLMGVFLMMSRGTNEPEHTWILSGINIKLALTLGLQHDANKFRLSEEEVENRQYVLGSVVSAEIWQSLSVGRPPSQTFASFDWVFPEKPEDADPSKSARHWAASFIRDCSTKVLEAVVGHKVTSYSGILQLDATIREYPVPPEAFDISQGIEELGIGTMMQRTFMGIIKEVCLLFLHRRCFAIALRDRPDDPLKSPFAPSVMACHRSAAAFISRTSMIHSIIPQLISRIWFVWPNVFVATLVLGSIVARSPRCSLASSSLFELEMACQLWETVSDSVCGSKVLTTVRELKQKAFMSFARNNDTRDPSSIPPGGIEISNEIHALGGGGPTVISTTPKSGSSTSSPYSPEHQTISQSPSPATASRDYTSIQARNEPNRDQPPSTFTTIIPSDSSFSPMASQFDFGVDFSSQLPDFSGNTGLNDFNDVLGAMGISTASEEAPPVGSNILEELGLGGGWQPVMDHLGL